VSQAQARTPSRSSSLAQRGSGSSGKASGRFHPLIAAGGGYAVLAGLASFTLGMINTAHLAGSILGSTGFLVGLLSQMVSVTRAERIIIVFGITASFVGMGLGIAHGGFS